MRVESVYSLWQRSWGKRRRPRNFNAAGSRSLSAFGRKRKSIQWDSTLFQPHPPFSWNSRKHLVSLAIPVPETSHPIAQSLNTVLYTKQQTSNSTCVFPESLSKFHWPLLTTAETWHCPVDEPTTSCFPCPKGQERFDHSLSLADNHWYFHW